MITRERTLIITRAGSSKDYEGGYSYDYEGMVL